LNNRGEFLTYIDNLGDKTKTQQKLNETRQSLFEKQRIKRWVTASENETGYPFALNCDRPHADVYGAIKNRT
jgi:hypothetical protein